MVGYKWVLCIDILFTQFGLLFLYQFCHAIVINVPFDVSKLNTVISTPLTRGKKGGLGSVFIVIYVLTVIYIIYFQYSIIVELWKTVEGRYLFVYAIFACIVSCGYHFLTENAINSPICDMVGSDHETGLIQSIADCVNVEDLKQLDNRILFGYTVPLKDFANLTLWTRFEDPLEVLNWILHYHQKQGLNFSYLLSNTLKIDQNSNQEEIEQHNAGAKIWDAILSNLTLSEKDESYWNELFTKGHLKNYINGTPAIEDDDNLSPFAQCVIVMQEDELIKFLVNNYGAKITESIYYRLQSEVELAISTNGFVREELLQWMGAVLHLQIEIKL